MAQIANWNGHTFEVSPNLVRGFTQLTIRGSCETTTKNSSKQKYVKRKYGETPEISMTVGLSALMGVTDVYGEALAFVNEATEGACAYFYLGTSKLIPAKMMLVSAEIVDVENMPGQGDKWVACNVQLSFKQGSKKDGSGSSGSSGGSKKASVKKTSVKKNEANYTLLTVDKLSNQQYQYAPSVQAFNKLVGNAVKVVSDAKTASKATKNTATGLAAQSSRVNKATTTTANSAAKKSATTGRIGGGAR